MQKEMFEDRDPEEKEKSLSDTCDKVENFSYDKSFTNQDVDMFRERLSDLMISIGKFDIEIAKIKKQYMEDTKPMRLEIKELLENIRFRSRMVEERAYVFIDHEDNRVGYYNSQGMLIHERMLNIDEHQRSIMSAARQAEKIKTSAKKHAVDAEVVK